MQNIFLRLIALIFVLLLILIGIGYLLPRSYSLEASIDIDAPVEHVFPLVNELPNWQQWSTFSEERIESLKVTYGSQRSGEGASQTWTDARGGGKLWITKSLPNEVVEYDLNFGEFPTMKSQIRFETHGQRTLIHWSSQGSLPPGAFYGYTALLFPGQMNYEYEKSLERLKNVAEK